MSNKLKQARLAAGLTQAQAAEYLQIPPRTIQNWDEGHASPPKWAERLILQEYEKLLK